ncbi:MAG: hypothetical protein KF861_10295 [Planctomycetaceae bacterium]|nr:hypothetical protein [Planctomycetaceae bacterium]
MGALALLVVLYSLSIGPACWICMRLDPLKDAHVQRVVGLSYTPVVCGLLHGPQTIKVAADWFIQLGAPAGTTVNRWDWTGIRWTQGEWNITFLGW